MDETRQNKTGIARIQAQLKKKNMSQAIFFHLQTRQHNKDLTEDKPHRDDDGEVHCG